jgi:mannose-6-phosphate isomerase-like protein (cupin superfamily)
MELMSSGNFTKARTGAPIILQKPYGENRIIEVCETCGISVARFMPGKGTSMHYHHRRREVICGVAGSIRFITESDNQLLELGSYALTTPLVPHRLLNESGSVAEVIEFFSPGALSDKVRLSDQYGRKLGDVVFSD